MILSKAKAAGLGAGLLLVIATGALIYWLNAERDKLTARVATQAQQLSNAAQANRENLLAISSLQASIQWRDERALERQQREARRETELNQTREQLRKAMQDAPDCVNQPWPDAVFDIMRKNTVRDPNRVRSGAGTGGVPAADTNTRAGG
ncbi:DUF2570 domain-containing protein [Marinobacter shengliensis]|uniref:DUF2570 domain-containing protein n=1 Tax=Marinobacter shengliensis TaxID=1389223 RepID=UPI00110932E7|nr:DUF2570 domain-containing protein [Marinobacter shengliensis]